MLFLRTQVRHRPGDLPVGARHRDRSRAAGRRPAHARRRRRATSRRRSAPGASAAGSRRAAWSAYSHGRHGDPGGLRAVRRPLRRRPARREHARRLETAGRGHRPAHLPRRATCRLRHRRRAARATTWPPATDRALAAPEAPERHLRAGGVHRGRGDGPDARPLVVAVERRAAGRAGRRDPGPDLAHRRPGQPRPPARRPSAIRPPARPTPSPSCSCWGWTGPGSRCRTSEEYLATASWDAHALSIVTLSRDQKTHAPARRRSRDRAVRRWCARTPTRPGWTSSPACPPTSTTARWSGWPPPTAATACSSATAPVTPPTLQVRAVLDVDHDSVLFSASGDPTEIQLWTWDGHSLLPVSTRSGVFSGRMAGGVGVLTEQSLDAEGVVHHGGAPRRHGDPDPLLAERPGLDLRVSLGRSGRRDLSTAVLLPSWHEPGSRPLPGPDGSVRRAARAARAQPARRLSWRASGSPSRASP